MEIVVRPLTIKDRKTLSAMIQKMAENFGSQDILNIISPAVALSPSGANSETSNTDSSSNKTIDIGIKILKKLIETLESDVHSWFADLIGVSLEEFDTLPIDTELVILSQLSEMPEVERFFMTASQLSSKAKGLKSRFANSKGK